MISIRPLILAAAAAVVLTGCQPAANTAVNNAGNAGNRNTNVNSNAARSAAPAKETLMALEKQGWEAWKARSPQGFTASMSDKYVGFSPNGREDKAAWIKGFEQKCEIKSYSFSDDQMNMVGPDVAVLSFKAVQDYTCDGKKGPENVWASSIYVREGDTWKSVFYAENPVVDPNAPAPKAAPAASATPSPGGAGPDTLASTLMAVENRAWEAWKNRDARAVEEVMAKDFMSVSGSGRNDRAASVKAWSEPKCEGLAYTLSDPKAVTLTSDVALVTYKAEQKGSCDGKPVPPSLWAASLNVKEDGNWKNAFFTEKLP